MIKAEVISHEGNPGPNWLDRCRTIITPEKITVVMVCIALVAIGAIVLRSTNNDKTPVTSASQQASPANSSLKVQPLQSEGTPDSAAAIQPAPGGTSSNQAQAETTTPLGTAPAAPLGGGNSAGSPAQQAPVTNQQSTFDQTKLKSNLLTNTVQSTLQNVQKTRQTLTDRLGL